MIKLVEWETGGYFYKMYSLGPDLILIIEEDQMTHKTKCSVFKKV